MNNIFGEMTAADILSHINNISNQIRYIYDACEDCPTWAMVTAANLAHPAT